MAERARGGGDVTVERIDELLEAWEARLARVDANLVALEADPTYQVLARPGGVKESLEGVTRQRIVPALEAIEQLFDGRQRLAHVVAEARESRGRVSALTFWENDDHLRRALELLETPSIHLAVEPTPLAARALLGEAMRDTTIAPEVLLDEMARRFDVARDAIAALSRAWSALERDLDAMEREVADLHATTDGLSPRDPLASEVAAIEREIAHLRRAAGVDPLGADASRAHVLGPRMAALRERAMAAHELRQRARDSLAHAHAQHRALAEGHARAREALARAGRRFAPASDPWPLPCDDDSLDGLATWLETLDKTVSIGHWGPACVGLERWMDAAVRYGAVDAAVERAVGDRERRLADVVGRISARRAQATAIAARAPSADRDPRVARARARLSEAMTRFAAQVDATPIDVDAIEAAAREVERAMAELREDPR
jgi:hypothetical protein